MNKLVHDINDYLLNNRYEELSEICNKLPEDFIKSAEILLPDELTGLENHEFALVMFDSDGITRKYACNNEEMTILNTEIFMCDADIMPDEVCKTAAYYLARACKKYNYTEGEEKLSKYLLDAIPESNIVVLEDIDKIKLHIKKEASLATTPDSLDYALPDYKKYPLNSSEDVKAAIEYFDIYEDHFKQADKLIYSMNTLHAAQKFGTVVDPSVNKIASYGILNPMCHNSQILGHLDVRSYLADEEYAPVYHELKEKIAEYSPMELTDVLTKVDTEAGLSFLWGSTIDDPIKCCLEPIKTANMSIDSRVITLTDIHRILENEKLSEYLDSNSINELRTFDALQVFSTLPYPVRSELYKLL